MQYAFTYIFFVVFSQLIIACRKGGTSIEDLAEKFPDMIVKVVILLFYFWWLMIIIDIDSPSVLKCNWCNVCFDRFPLMFLLELPMKMLQRLLMAWLPRWLIEKIQLNKWRNYTNYFASVTAHYWKWA